MRSLRVYGGNLIVRGKDCRAIVATATKRGAAELFGVSVGHFNTWFTESFNEKENEVAKNTPETVFVNFNQFSSDSPYIRLQDAKNATI
jgi:hypothetical protein